MSDEVCSKCGRPCFLCGVGHLTADVTAVDTEALARELVEKLDLTKRAPKNREQR